MRFPALPVTLIHFSSDTDTHRRLLTRRCLPHIERPQLRRRSHLGPPQRVHLRRPILLLPRLPLWTRQKLASWRSSSTLARGRPCRWCTAKRLSPSHAPPGSTRCSWPQRTAFCRRRPPTAVTLQTALRLRSANGAAGRCAPRPGWARLQTAPSPATRTATPAATTMAPTHRRRGSDTGASGACRASRACARSLELECDAIDPRFCPPPTPYPLRRPATDATRGAYHPRCAHEPSGWTGSVASACPTPCARDSALGLLLRTPSLDRAQRRLGLVKHR